MAPVTNGRSIYAEIPEDFPIPGKTIVYDTTETIDLENVPLNGGVLIKLLVLSIDPYLRGKMNALDTKTYTSMLIPGETLYNFGVGKVLRSESPDVPEGSHVSGVMRFEEYQIKASAAGLKVLPPKSDLPWSVYVGVAGMPGKTAFLGWRAHAKPKKGETVFVTSGAGPVGSFVIQLAKLDGLKVIASAGSDEKVEFMKKIGADVVFNYKTTDITELLKKEGPIDIFWDNVGGPTLNAALVAASKWARFLECGMISGYNSSNKPAITNMFEVVAKSITMSGFIFTHLEERYPELVEEFYATVPELVARGEIQYLEDVTRGLDKAADAILAVQKGTNTGKSVVLVADD